MIGVRLFVAAALLAISRVQPATAQDYPNKPIKLIVPTAPAGIGDIIARQMQQKLSEIRRHRSWSRTGPAQPA